MSHSLAPARGEIVGSRFAEVARTYARQWIFRVQIPALLAMIVVIFLFAPEWRLMQILLGEIMVIQVGIFSMSVAIHLKEQMDDWRSRLTPGFGLPHLGLGAVILGVVAIGMPVVLCEPLGASMAGLLGVTLAISAVATFAVYEPVIVMISAVPFGIASTSGVEYILEMLRGGHIAVASGISLASLGMLSLLWFCMSGLSGEGIRIDRPMDINFRRPTATGWARTMGPLTNWLNAYLRRRWNDVEKPTRKVGGEAVLLETSWSRIRHRSVVMGQGVNYGWAGMVGMLVFVAMIMGARYFYRDAQNYGGANQFEPTMLMVAFGPIYLSMFLCGLIWPQRWLHLPMESLLPASRRGFVRESGAAMGLGMMKLWASSTLVAVAGAAVFAPGVIRSHAANLVAIAAIAAAAQIYMFGVIVWGLWMRNGIFSGLALLVATAGSMPAVGMQMSDKTPVVFVHVGLWCAALLLVGGLLTFDAYRRWIRTEMD